MFERATVLKMLFMEYRRSTFEFRDGKILKTFYRIFVCRSPHLVHMYDALNAAIFHSNLHYWFNMVDFKVK